MVWLAYPNGCGFYLGRKLPQFWALAKRSDLYRIMSQRIRHSVI
jgi:hypothetical protein